MGRRASSPMDVVFVAESYSARLTLNYFFSVVFGCQTRILPDVAEASRMLSAMEPPRMVVLGLSQFEDAAFRLITQASRLEPKPFILALTRDPDPETAASLFEAGADEALRFPFTLKELAYRLRSRSGEIGLTFNFDAEQAKTLDIAADIVRRADLTDIEAQVVLVLAGHEGEIVSRDALSMAIDKTPWDYGNRKFDVHVARIRKKLDSAYGGELTVRTVRSAGYQLTFCPGDGCPPTN